MCTHDNHKTTTLLQRFKGIGTKIKCIFVPGTEPNLTQKQTITFTLTQLQRIRVHIPLDWLFPGHVERYRADLFSKYSNSIFSVVF